jgi:hypothetical protein
VEAKNRLGKMKHKKKAEKTGPLLMRVLWRREWVYVTDQLPD